ncbi:MAG: glycosyltransferase [Myxococcota bacterium]
MLPTPVSSRRTALLISRFFPPGFQIGGKRAYRFARYLPQFGWRPVVWTVADDQMGRVDPTALKVPAPAIVEPTLMPHWWPEAPSRRQAGGKEPGTPTHAKFGWRRRLRRQFTVPVGDELFLIPFMRQRIDAIMRTHKPDVVYATAAPYWTLPLALTVAHRYDLPLCFDLRDPWSFQFLQVHKAPWVRWAERHAERYYLNRADRIVFTSEDTTARYRTLYPKLAERMATITNAYDPGQAPAHDPVRPSDLQGRKLLVHFGNCYGPRNLRPIIEAIDRLDPAIKESVVLLNLGQPSREDIALAERLGVDFRIESFVPLAEGLALLAAADAQILMPLDEWAVPGKTYDFLTAGSRRSIASMIGRRLRGP